MRRAATTAVLLLALAPGPALAQDPGRPDPRIADGSAQRALDAARAAWRASGVRSYRYEASTRCFCLPREPERVVVRGGRSSSRSRLGSVPRLHRLVQGLIDQRVSGLDVTYDRRGVPRSIAIDVNHLSIDDEHEHHVRRFARLRPRQPSSPSQESSTRSTRTSSGPRKAFDDRG